MKSKGLTLVGFSILAIFLFVGLASAAALELEAVSVPTSVNQGETTVYVTFNLSAPDATVNYTALNWSGSSSNIGSWTILPTLTAINIGDDIALNATLTIPAGATGTINATIDVQSETAAEAQLNMLIPVNVPVTYEFCSGGAIDEDDLTFSVDIKNTGEGDDHDWLPLDVIEVEVELDNDKDNIDLDNVIFEIGLYEEGDSTNIIDDMIWLSEDDEEYEYGDIDENEDGAHVFEFKIDPDEVSSGDYILMVKAFPDGDESDTCIDYSSDLADNDFGDSEYYAEIEISKETDRDKMVIVDEDSVDLIEAACGQQVAFTADVWNIGDRDYEDQIMVSLYSQDLGIDLQEVVLGDLDEGDDAEVSFVFEVPRDAQTKLYSLFMKTYYDYDEGEGKYEDDYDRKSEDNYKVSLSVSGNCVTDAGATPTVSASLESEAKAGEALEVKVTITNPGNATATYVVNAAGYAGWASSATLSQDSFTLGAGESIEVMVNFDVNSDVEGEKTFNIELLSEGQFVSSQPVSVYIQAAGGFGLGAFSENSTAYALGLLNIILIVVIIIVAIRVSRK